MCVVRRSNNTFGDRCFATLVHVYGTGCHHIYASVIVSDNLNGCSRLICLVLETAALCDISIRSAVYKSSYLLTCCNKFLPTIILVILVQQSVRCILPITYEVDEYHLASWFSLALSMSRSKVKGQQFTAME